MKYGPETKTVEAFLRHLKRMTELHDVLSELLEHSIARYGNPVHEGWGIGLVHANARRALAALKATNPIPKEPK